MLTSLCVFPGHVDKVKDMLGQKPSMVTIEGKDGATPLMFASNKGHKEVCSIRNK